ncbi:MAG: hypothetical protein IJM75_08410 [Ruminococcus sp.]|nr:hypothetical protein [Ruminococcus sp.]
MEKRRFKQNENGAVLLTVLCVMLMMIILVGASISFVSTTTQRTYRTFQAEQAYMTANSCLQTYVKDIELKTNAEGDEAAQKEAIDNLVALSLDNGGKGYEYDVIINGETDIEKMGSCTIRVSRFNDSTIVITATSKFGSETEQVAAYVQTNTKPRSTSYSNAIEICNDNKNTFNNLHVLGEVATITGNDKTKSNFITNDTTLDGSLKLYGNTSTATNPHVYFMQGLSDDSSGGNLMIWGDLTDNNSFKVTTKIPKGDTNSDNFVLVNGKFSVLSSGGYLGNVKDGGLETGDEGKSKRTNPYEVDLFCYDMLIHDINYYQLGNIIVGGGGTGTFTVEGGGVGGEIWGDIVVDGKFNYTANNPITVHGSVWCTSDIPDKIVVVGEGNAKHPNAKQADLPSTGRFKRPVMEDTYNEYELMPEDFIANPDSTKGILKNQYDALHSSTAPTVKSIYESQQNNTTGSFVSGEALITSGTNKYVQYTDTDGTKSNYLCSINKSCVLNNEIAQGGILWQRSQNGKILVHVTNQDIVILLQGYNNWENKRVCDFGNAPTIVVKNDSSDSSPHYCYFVTDAGTNVGYKTASDRSKNQTVVFNMYKGSVIDYGLYKAMCKDGVLLDADSVLTTSNIKDDFALNLTSNTTIDTDPNAYNPGEENIYYLITNGSTISNSDDNFHEGIIYAPEGTYSYATQGSLTFPKVYMTKDGYSETFVPIVSLGMVIAGNYSSQNKSYYAFNEPAPKSAMGLAKKSKQNTLSGYNLLRYDHH